MKNSIFTFFLILILFQACKKDEDLIPTCENCSFTCIDMNDTDVITNNCIDNWECTFRVVPQSKVHLIENYGVSAGDKNVFQMINFTEGALEIADDEFTNILVFELNESQNSFSVEDSELIKMKVHFRISCFCSEVEFKPVTSGCIQGEKQSDGTWFIQGNLKIPYSYGDVEVKFDAQFLN